MNLTLSHRYRCYQGFICVVQISEISSRRFENARYNSGSVLNGRCDRYDAEYFLLPMCVCVCVSDCGFKFMVKCLYCVLWNFEMKLVYVIYFERLKEPKRKELGGLGENGYNENQYWSILHKTCEKKKIVHKVLISFDL